LEKEDIYSEPPVEGGPKVAELPEDRVDSERLIEVLKERKSRMLSLKTSEPLV
jgi:hypothetical protein